MDVLAKELPPGAKLRIEMTSRYLISELCKPAKGETICYGGKDRFSLPAQGRLVWEFKATEKQPVGKTSYTFVFPKPFKAAPPQFHAFIVLPTSTRLELPGSNGQPGKVVDFGENPFGMPLGETKSYYRCFRVVGSPKPRVNLAESCDAPYKPGIGIPASRMTGRKP